MRLPYISLFLFVTSCHANSDTSGVDYANEVSVENFSEMFDLSDIEPYIGSTDVSVNLVENEFGSYYLAKGRHNCGVISEVLGDSYKLRSLTYGDKELAYFCGDVLNFGRYLKFSDKPVPFNSEEVVIVKGDSGSVRFDGLYVKGPRGLYFNKVNGDDLSLITAEDDPRNRKRVLISLSEKADIFDILLSDYGEIEGITKVESRLVNGGLNFKALSLIEVEMVSKYLPEEYGNFFYSFSFPNGRVGYVNEKDILNIEYDDL